ncbi:MAG: cysteine synthase family protein [Candidatus Lernaella stagnicola]|nr:cysteine synthase family protein [Candidatus Lernaella stagnicola]
MNHKTPSVLDLIGNTPLVEVRRLNPKPGRVKIMAKLEGANPGGSIKDRVALSMIEGAERDGRLRPGMTVLEATSGNTGIGIAMVCAVKGYGCLLVMSEGVSIERRKILAAYGAEFLLTPAELATDGAIEKVYEMEREDGGGTYCLVDQYNNDANPMAHYRGTGPEIWRQTDGEITHFVAALGTTGTIMGHSRFFREKNPAIRIIAAEPNISHKIQGLKSLKASYVPGIWNKQAVDEKHVVSDDDAYAMTRRLAREEGILCGMSSGAAMHVAVQAAQEVDRGVIVVILPDGGERYLSTDLFRVPQE